MSSDYENLTKDEERLIKELLPNFVGGQYVRTKPSGYVLSSRIDFAGVKRMPFYKDDIFIVTPAKSGTTWTQEIVWLMMNEVDLDGAKVNQFYRVPFIEIHGIVPKDERPYPEGEPLTQQNRLRFQAHSLEYISRMASRPRIIKTHLPLHLLPDGILDKSRIIFVSRNPKDVAVSLFYHYGLRDGINCEDKTNFEPFVKLFMKGCIAFTPIVPMALEAWKCRHHKNLLFLTYEDMKTDLDAVLQKLMKFLKIDLSDEKLMSLKDAVDFDKIKKNPYVNKADELGASFIRKGIVGDWKTHFSPTTNMEFDAWLKDQLTNTDFKYPM